MKSYLAAVRGLHERSPARAVTTAIAGVLLATLPIAVLVGAGVAAYYVGESGELASVGVAAIIVTLAGLAAESFRRWRPWRRILAWRLAEYADRAGDRAVHFRMADGDLPAARRALKRAGYLVDVPAWRTGEKVQIEARYRPESKPAEEPERVLEQAGISFDRTGNSTSLGPGSAWPM